MQKSRLLAFSSFTRPTLAATAVAACVLPMLASAATVQVAYRFDTTQINPLAATSVLDGGVATTNVTASAVTPSGYQATSTANGPADTPTTANRFILSSTGGNGGGDAGHLSIFFPNSTEANNSEAEVVSLGHYFDVVLAPAAGYTLDLTTLNVDYTANNNTNGRNYFVRYDHSGVPNNFAGPNIVGAQFNGTLNTWVTGAGAAGNLNGIPIVNSGESVTLRFFTYRTDILNTAQNFRFDNIVITGELTAVPEPSTSLLAGAFVIAGLLRRNR